MKNKKHNILRRYFLPLLLSVCTAVSFPASVSAYGEEAAVPDTAQESFECPVGGVNETRKLVYDNDTYIAGDNISEVSSSLAGDIVNSGETVITAGQYNALTDEEKALYALVTTAGDVQLSYNSGDAQNVNTVVIVSDSYVKKGTNVWIFSEMEKYVGNDITLNGKIFSVGPSGDSVSNFGNLHTVDGDLTISMQPRAELTAFERENFVPIKKLGQGISIYKHIDSDIFGDIIDMNLNIEEGDYLNKNAEYAVRADISAVENSYIVLCGKIADYEVNNSSEAQIWQYYVPADVSEFTAEIMCDLFAVLSPEKYTALDAAAKSQYAQVGFNGLYVSYIKEGETGGTFIETGSYVKKGTMLYFGIPQDEFIGNYLTVIHDDAVDDYTEMVYLMYNGSDSWIYPYTVKNSDISIFAESISDAPGVLSPEEYANWIPDMKSYYAKVNIQSPAYVGIGGGENFFILSDGYYVLKNIHMWVAAFPNDYVGNRVLVNGEPFDVTLQPDFGNYGGVYVVGGGENNITVEIEPDSSWKNAAVSIDDESGIEAYYYKGASSEPGLGKEVYSGDNIPVGTPIMISCYKNLIFGYDITVNGEIVTLWEDGAYMSGIYCSDEKELYIRKEKRELNDYEKTNCVPIYFGSGIEVVEFPFSGGGSGNEWHITYDSGDIIEKGTALRIFVTPSDYAGKALKINGTEFNMDINDDGSSYLLNYRIPQDADSVEITLEAKTSGVLGDVDGNSEFTIMDIVILANAYRNNNADQYLAVADTDGNGKITIMDIVKLCNIYRGK